MGGAEVFWAAYEQGAMGKNWRLLSWWKPSTYLFAHSCTAARNVRMKHFNEKPFDAFSRHLTMTHLQYELPPLASRFVHGGSNMTHPSEAPLLLWNAKYLTIIDQSIRDRIEKEGAHLRLRHLLYEPRSSFYFLPLSLCSVWYQTWRLGARVVWSRIGWIYHNLEFIL